MIATTFAALLSHWRRNWLQLVMLLSGLALATALWSGVQALNAEARRAYDTAASLMATGDLPRIEAVSGTIATDDFARLRRAGWAVSPVIETRFNLEGVRVTLLGIEPLTSPGNGSGLELANQDLSGFALGTGAQAPIAYAHPETLRGLSTDRLSLRAAQAVPVGTVLVDIGVAERLTLMDGRLTRLVLDPEARDGLRPVSELTPHLSLVAPDRRNDLAGLTDSFHLNLTAFGLLAFAVGLFIVHSAVGLAFEGRRGVFRTLRALGVPLRSLVALLAAEITVFALVAGALGLGLGYLMASALLPDVAMTLRGLYGAPVPGTLAFDPVWALAGMGMTLAGAALAGGQALWRLWRMPILAPAQPRAWAVASARGMRMQLSVALVLGMLAGALALTGTGLVAGFTLLAAALIACALMMPPVLAMLLALGARAARSPLTEWFFADSRQNLPRLSLPLMALMLALAANIGVGTMVSSFRATFIGWLDQRLVAEVNVTARSEPEAQALRAFLEPKVYAILPVRSVDALLAGYPGEIYVMVDHASYRDHWPMINAIPDVWDELAAGGGVLVNEQLARRADLWPGASLELPGAGRFAVIGVYPDYGNPRAQAIIGAAPFNDAYPDAPYLQHALRLAPADVPALIASLQDDFGLPAAQITDQARAKEISLAIFERTFLITGALNLLTLSVAALALFAALVTLAGIRLAQLAPLWALGLTVRRLAALDLARMLLLAGLTMMFALPVGLGLAQLLLGVINVQAFGWRLPMQLFPLDWLRLYGAAGIAVLAAAIVPVLRLARSAPATLLKVFAHER